MREGARRVLTVGLEERNELIVGKATGLWEAVHTAADLHVDITVVEQGIEVVLFDDGSGKHPDWGSHILIAIHGCAEIEVLEIDAEKASFRSRQNAVEEQFSSR